MLRMRNPLSLLTTALASTLTASVALAPALASAQSAAEYPAKSVRVVVAQAPGGGTDIQARLFSAKLSENLGKQFLVENRAGAGNTIGIMYVVKAPPDGYTLLASTPGLTFAPAIQKNAPYDPVKDFTPISNVTRAPYLLVVHPSVPATNMQEFIVYAKANPGKLNAGAGSGTLTHIAMAWMSDLAGIQLTHIPYKGTGPVLIDIVGGRLQVAFGNPLSTLTLVKAGKLRALATSMNKRSFVLPDLPTIAESGLAGYDLNTWHGWLGPAGLSPIIANKMSVELGKVVRFPQIAEQLKDDGGEAVGSTPEEFRQLIASESVRWRKVAAANNISVD
jgi:tripartite-type tricarboxylate transporter receptor subunit TctC